MITTLSIILFTIFIFLSLIHFYWLFGGKWGLQKVIPTKENQTSSLVIPKFATLIVALGLLFFGLLYLLKSGLINVDYSNVIMKYGYWIIPSIFILRAIGDFNYVGLFKRIKNTAFAKADSKLFVPLCLIIGLLGLSIQFLS